MELVFVSVIEDQVICFPVISQLHVFIYWLHPSALSQADCSLIPRWKFPVWERDHIFLMGFHIQGTMYYYCNYSNNSRF